ncbi:MAG: hypothetical protein VKL39_00530 [Leptolyngbyaceae bacterium]|nr:hypothetical protein [Leptolyngbyaceae bacterium]
MTIAIDNCNEFSKAKFSTLMNRVSIWHLLRHLIRYAQRLYWLDTLL